MGEMYVDNKKFYEAIKAYKAECAKAAAEGKPKPRLSNYIGSCILLIAQKMSTHRNWNKYPFREEMVSDGIENCITYFDNFDPEKYQNPFAYFTQIIYFAFLRRIEREHTMLYTKFKMMQNTVTLDEGFNFQEGDEDVSLSEGLSHAVTDNQNMNDFINYFEKSQKRKKARRASKKKGVEKFAEDDAT